MGQKRMFSLAVVDTDRFLEMPVSAQALYFHLGMHGDDDGFVASPRKIARSVGCNLDDLRLLAQKNFIIPFESGVIVIVDWSINNTLRNDRYNPTTHQMEKALLTTTTTGAYTRIADNGIPTGSNPDTNGIPAVSSLEPQHNITEHNIAEQNGTKYFMGDSVKSPKAGKPPKTTRFTPPTVDQVKAYCQERGNSINPQHFVDFYETRGWMAGKNKMKDWKAAIRTWERNNIAQPERKEADTYRQEYDDIYDRIGTVV